MTAPSAPQPSRTTQTRKSTASAKRPTATKTASTPAKPAKAPPSAPVKAKRAAPSKAPKAAAPAKVAQPAAPAPKEKKVKVVRDSFTIPKNEFSQLGEMKKKAIGLGLEVKKSELIRAGLLLLNSASDAAFKKALANVPTLKTGRPGKN
jgi:hypothetical protein